MLSIGLRRVIRLSVATTTLLQLACGEDMSFKETELGRFMVTVGNEPSPDGNSTEGSVAIEEVTNSTPAAEGLSDGTQNPDGSTLVDELFSESSRPDDSIVLNKEFKSESIPQSSDRLVDEEGGNSNSVATGDNSSVNGAAVSTKSGNSKAGNTAADKSSNVDDGQVVKLCAELFKGRASFVKLVNPEKPSSALTMTGDTVLAVKLSGNQQKFALDIAGNQKIAGICIVATGNQPLVDISSSVDINQIAFVGRGNQSKASFNFNADVSLDSAFVSLKGNSHTVAFNGVGASICEGLQGQVKSSTLTCN